MGLLGAMKLTKEGFDTTVYSRTPAASGLQDLVAGFGAKFVRRRDRESGELAESLGNIDLIYEAVGASSLAFEMMPYLGTNGVFIFTGVPGRKGPVSVDTDALMRERAEEPGNLRDRERQPAEFCRRHRESGRVSGTLARGPALADHRAIPH